MMTPYAFPYTRPNEAFGMRLTLDGTPVEHTFPSRFVLIEVETGGPVWFRTDGQPADSTTTSAPAGISTRLTTSHGKFPVMLSQTRKLSLVAPGGATVSIMPANVEQVRVRVDESQLWVDD